MHTVNDVLGHKGSQVFSIHPEATVLDAALLMNEHQVGAVVVTSGQRVAGIFTERDVLRRIVARRLDPAQMAVRDAMTQDVICCRCDVPLEEARTIFRNKRIRHLPVVDDRGQLKGMISIGDLNAWELNGKEVTIQYLQEYIYGTI